MVRFVSGGELFGAFMIIPLTLIGWNFGQRAGIVAAVAGIGFTEVVFNGDYFFIRHLGIAPYWVQIVIAPALVFTFVGIVVGKLGETIGELQKTIELKTQLEQTLMAAQQSAQQYLDVAEVILLVLDRDRRITLLNKKGNGILGYEEGELIGKDFVTKCVPSQMREEVADSLTKLMNSEPAMEYHENPVLTKNGEERLIAWHNTLIMDKEGSPIASLSSGEDITERRKADEALKASHAHSNAVLNALPDTLYEVDREGTIYDFRTSRPDLLLFPQEISPIGKKVADALSAEVAEVGLNAVAQAGRSGWFKSPTVAFTNNGKTRWYELSIAAVGDYREKDCHFIVLARDVTERTRLEQQLIQSQKMEAIGRLAGGIAHDFNNILMVIIGYCDVIQMVQEDRHQLMERVKVIKDSAQRAAALTHQLLAFSRKQILSPRNVDVDELIEDSRAMLIKMLSEDIAFTHESSGKGNVVKADPSQLQQVIMNLTVNARDAMPEGGTFTIGVQSVEIHEEDARRPVEMVPADYVLIQVSDTGSGMDAETLSHMFEPFFTTKELGRGTGLGLSIVYGIVKQSEGYVYVESKLGSGTTFRIYLPRVQEAGEKSMSSPDEEHHGTETILLVEDEDDVRRLILQHLKGCGYSVFEASSGPDALKICQKHTNDIHLLITDVGLPGLKGWKVVEGFRESNPHGRIIYMTGYTDPFGLTEIDDKDKAEILQKPFNMVDLATRIRKLLDEPRSTDSL
jgi:PAS domain S-box-containing protein